MEDKREQTLDSGSHMEQDVESEAKNEESSDICKFDEECLNHEICIQGSCENIKCKKYQDCKFGQRCSSRKRICEDIPPCKRDEDCIGNRACNTRTGECIVYVP